MFRSLRHRNFRLYFAGQFVSFCGSWIQNTALAWLTYRLTRDPLMLGLVTFVNQFPVFLFGLHAGHAVDRFSHRRIVIWMQLLAMAQSMILAALTLSGRIEVWHLFALALMLGLIYSIEVPARQVLVGELVPLEDRHNAIALNSTIVNGSRIIGPAVAGLVIGWAGEGWCFALNSATYLAVLAGLLLMRDVRQSAPAAGGAMWQEIRNGIRYVAARPALRAALALLTVLSVAGMPVYVLLPIFAAEIVGGGARGLGWLSSMAGLGATLGALRLAGRRGPAGLGRLIAQSLGLMGAGLLGLGASSRFAFSAALMWLIGFSVIHVLAGINTLLQELSADRYRGRVMAFYSMIFIGLAPLGSFLAGALAARAGVRATVMVEALALLGAGAWALRRFPALLETVETGPLGPGQAGPFNDAEPVGGP